MERVSISLADVTANATATDPVEIDAGTIIKAVYVELWISSQANNVGQMNAIVSKATQNAGISFANMQNLHSAPFKRNIFYTTQGLTPDSNANPTPFIRQWIKIPKGKQRFGVGDTLVLTVGNLNPTTDIDMCGFMLYKAYQ